MYIYIYIYTHTDKLTRGCKILKNVVAHLPFGCLVVCWDVNQAGNFASPGQTICKTYMYYISII